MQKTRHIGICTASVLGALFFAGSTLYGQVEEPAAPAPAETPAAETAAVPAEPDYAKISDRYTTEYEGIAFEADLSKQTADDLVREAVKAFKGGNYKDAVDYYREAIAFLEKVENRNEAMARKISNCKEAISRCYYYWAEKLYLEALDSAESAQFDEAVKKCELAAEVWPASRSRMDEAIRKFKEMQASAKYQKEISTETVIPELKERTYSIDVLLRQGEAYYNDGQYIQARDKFEEVTAIDPYNVTAIDSIRKCYKQIEYAGRFRTETTHSEMISEVSWKAVSPLIPRLTANDVGKRELNETSTTIVKEDRTKLIQKKLDEIVIDMVSFDDLPIDEAIRFLKEKSRKMDPAGEGVNIIYLPEAPKSEEDEAENGMGIPGMAGMPGMFGMDNSGGMAGMAAMPGMTGMPGMPGMGNAKNEEEEIPTVKLNADNLPLIYVIRQMCSAVNMKYKVDDYAVIIAPKDVPLDDHETNIYPVDQDLLDDMAEGAGGDIKTYFENNGIEFGKGANAHYINGRLIITNTPENLTKVEELLQQVSVSEPQILVEAKFVEVHLNDIEELGFHYLISRQNSNIDYAKVGSDDIQIATYHEADEEHDKGYWTNAPSKDSNSIIYSGKADDVIYAGRRSPVAYLQSTGTLSKGQTLDDLIAEPEDGQVVPYTLAPIQPDGSQASFNGPNSNMTRTINSLSEQTVLDGLFGFQTTNKYGYQFSATVNAVDQSDSTDILFCPRVTTTNDYMAQISMITEEYFPTEYSEAEISTIAGTDGTDHPMFTPSIPSFDDTEELGIKLKVQPFVDPSDNYTISMHIEPLVKEHVGWTDYSYPLTVTISEATENKKANTVTYTNILKMPIFETRQISTQVYCYDGETMVLGGLINDTSTAIDDQYPLLGNIPLVGRLFQSKAKTSTKANLLIYLTCRLILPDGSPYRERQMRGLPPFRQ